MRFTTAICPICLLKRVTLKTGTNSIPTTHWTPPMVENNSNTIVVAKISTTVDHPVNVQDKLNYNINAM